MAQRCGSADRSKWKMVSVSELNCPVIPYAVVCVCHHQPWSVFLYGTPVRKKEPILYKSSIWKIEFEQFNSLNRYYFLNIIHRLNVRERTKRTRSASDDAKRTMAHLRLKLWWINRTNNNTRFPDFVPKFRHKLCLFLAGVGMKKPRKVAITVSLSNLTFTPL